MTRSDQLEKSTGLCLKVIDVKLVLETRSTDKKLFARFNMC